jgi:UDP-glucose 4-epimerase
MAQNVALVTGIAGGLAQLVAAELYRRGFRVAGVDYRPFQGELGFPIEIHKANYNKTRIEDVFRRVGPTHVLHLGRVGNLKERLGKRFDLNVIGSRKLMDLSLKYGVRRLLVLSTFHIYGAHPHNHIPIFEDEPLRAGVDFPQLTDAVQLDTQAVLWCYKNPNVPTVILRPCNVLGPRLQNAISNFLRLPTLPYMLGFDPMVQVIEERDLTSAVVTALLGGTSGVFNVAGPHPLPWRTALGLTGARLVPVPSSFASLYLKAAGLLRASFPPYLLNFFKYPCVISDRAFREAFEWEPKVGEEECIQRTVAGGAGSLAS